ncbi:hypothetical protein C8R44DRAFT_800073 [Mycena epipterygia]|nr:hypothetical protein C8R44DRAFT_800073 [Mycena epipterygia]
MTAPDRQQDYLPPSPRAADAGTLHHPRCVLFCSPPRHASAPALIPTLDDPLVMLTWAAQIHGQCLLAPIHERYLAIDRPLPPLDSDERDSHLPRFWIPRARMLSPLRYPCLPRLVYPPTPPHPPGKCTYSPRIIYYAMLAVYPFPARIPAPCAPIHTAQITSMVTSSAIHSVGVRSWRTGASPLPVLNAFLPPSLFTRRDAGEVVGGSGGRPSHTMGNLASTYSQLRRFQKAEELQVEIALLEKQRKILGKHHPEPLRITGNLAAIYHNQGQLERARA